MSAHVLLNLLNEPSILSLFPNELNKFSNTGARISDSIYQMTQKIHLKSRFSAWFNEGFTFTFTCSQSGWVVTCFFYPYSVFN